MKKRVNVKINGPIYTVRPIIQRSLMNVEMTEGDIRNCICSNAMVEEILEDGSRVPLGLHNYNKDNNKKKKPQPKPQPKPEPKKETPAVNVKIKEDNRPKEEVKKVEPQVQKKPYVKPAMEVKEQPVQPKKEEVKAEEVKKETQEEKK